MDMKAIGSQTRHNARDSVSRNCICRTSHSRLLRERTKRGTPRTKSCCEGNGVVSLVSTGVRRFDAPMIDILFTKSGLWEFVRALQMGVERMKRRASRNNVP